MFTPLTAQHGSSLHDYLAHQGFRRSQTILYRPACEGCSACVSVRLVVDGFEPSRSFRRIMKKNADIVRTVEPAVATAEGYALLKRYLGSRHADGGMADMSEHDFKAMVEDTVVETTVFAYRLATGGEPRVRGPLIACALTDVLGDGLSMVYSYFEPAFEARSLGTYMILDHIAETRARNLDHVYLGYWVEGCRKMDYKSRFAPLEMLTEHGWVTCPQE